jgi:FkbM family methyltransferase
MKNPRIRFKHEYKYADAFQKYKQHSQINWLNQYKDLINNLDKNSIEIVNQTLTRHDKIMQNNLIEQHDLFTAQDYKEQKECSLEMMKLYRRFKKYSLSTFSPECFFGHSGLRWLPIEEKEKLQDGISIDGGACEGDTSIMLTHILRAREVHAFEIEKNNYKKLLKNVSLHNHNIKPYLIGLSDHAGFQSVNTEDISPTLDNNESKQRVEINTIDNLYSNKKVSLIKLDVEGEEMKVIKGAKNVISHNKPILSISIYHSPEDFFLIKKYIESINPEYRFLIRRASPFSLTNEIMLIAY